MASMDLRNTIRPSPTPSALDAHKDKLILGDKPKSIGVYCHLHLSVALQLMPPLEEL